MNLTQFPPPTRPTTLPVAREHVVFVLAQSERDLFLPHFLLIPGLLAKQTWVDASKLDNKAWLEKLEELQPSVLVTAWSCPPLPLKWALDEHCSLRYLCSITGAVKSRVPRPLLERGLLVSNWGNLISHTVAEHAMLMVLALLRNLAQWPELNQKPRSMFDMMPFLRSRRLRGKRVGLHGFGAIARELVQMLKPYQVELAAYSHGVPSSLYREHGIVECRNLTDLFSRSEILIECEGLNENSQGSVTEDILRCLPEDAIFVNVGRGFVVDEKALAKLAGEGRLRVGLDVYHKEPLPLDSPLHNQPRVLLSPHVAGPTWDTYPLCGTLAMDNIAKYLRGGMPDNRITLEIYDRAT